MLVLVKDAVPLPLIEVVKNYLIIKKAKLPYERLRDMIYTHPTMSEALNDLFKTPVVKS